MKRKMLLVEDDQLLLRAVKRCFANEWEVIAAPNTRDGFASALTANPDVIVVDVMLPDGDGLSLVTKMRAAGVTCPIVIASGHALGPDVAFTEFAGTVQKLLQKPYRPSELLKVLSSLSGPLS